MAKVSETVQVDETVAVSAAIEAVKESLLMSKTAPPVDHVSWELFTDANGTGAARIAVVLEDDPSGEPYSWEQVQPIHDLFWKEFTTRILDRWPYVRFRLKSEDTDKDEEDDEAGAGAEQPC